MKIKYFIIIFLSLMTKDLFAQKESSKINIYMSYSHAFGLKEQNVLWNLDGDREMYTNSFHVKGMYRMNRSLLLGIGVGADALRRWYRYTTFPIYASIHYHPKKDYPNMFLYNNIGYSIDTKISYPGLHYEAGLGYQWMFRKNFGMFVNVGYNLKQIRNIENDGKYLYTSRHSLSTALGFVF